jgi:hypothetical protein
VENVPGIQGKQYARPINFCENPAGHSPQVSMFDAPTVSENCPASHSLQTVGTDAPVEDSP